MSMDKAVFYAMLRKRDSGVFGTSLSQSQVNGIEGILDGFITHGDGRAKTLAYALATTVRETGSKMVPVREGFAKSDAAAQAYVQRNYGHKGKNWYCWPAGPYGHVYYGRGRVQETWYENYKKTSEEMGVDFVQFPDKRLDPVLDAQILFSGLLDGRWNGRGKGIAFYLPDDGPDDVKNARRTVNVLDHWEEIAGYYRAFMKAIDAADGVPVSDDEEIERAMQDILAEEPQEEPQPVPMPEPAPEPPSAPAGKSERRGVNPLAAAAAAIFGTIIVGATGFFEWVAEMVKWPWW